MLEVIDQDTPNILDPIYNKEEIYDTTIVNVEMPTDENDDIMHRVRHIISLTRDWIR